LAVADQRGLISIKGRRNQLLKVQGIRLHPAEIEEVVAQRWPECRPVVVPYQPLGCSASGPQTRLALFVVSDPSGQPTPQELRRHCLRELPRPKVPTHVESLTELPLGTSLKVDRAALSRRAEAASSGTDCLPPEPPQSSGSQR
jgi:acyl-CoA synthetase (AMP-forming)/AMP-acid ligase II